MKKFLKKFLPEDPSKGMIDSRNFISINTDMPSYVAGDVVTGNVVVNCLEPFFCNGFILRVVGKEKTFFEETYTETEDEYFNPYISVS